MNLQDNPTAIAQSEEMPRRPFAALRACQGIPTEALEAGVVRDMLEALQAVVSAYESGGMIEPIFMARAAIARATGEKP